MSQPRDTVVVVRVSSLGTLGNVRPPAAVASVAEGLEQPRRSVIATRVVEVGFSCIFISTRDHRFNHEPRDASRGHGAREQARQLPGLNQRARFWYTSLAAARRTATRPRTFRAMRRGTRRCCWMTLRRAACHESRAWKGVSAASRGARTPRVESSLADSAVTLRGYRPSPACGGPPTLLHGVPESCSVI